MGGEGMGGGESLLSPEGGVQRSPTLIASKDQKWDLFGLKGANKGVFGVEKYKEVNNLFLFLSITYFFVYVY